MLRDVDGTNGTDDGTDGQRTDDDNRTDDGTDGRTNDDDRTDTTGRDTYYVYMYIYIYILEQISRWRQGSGMGRKEDTYFTSR